MPEDGVTLTPTVLWAQRKDRLLITIDLPNPEHPRIFSNPALNFHQSSFFNSKATKNSHRPAYLFSIDSDPISVDNTQFLHSFYTVGNCTECNTDFLRNRTH